MEGDFMKKAVKLASVICGVLFLGNGLIMSVASNFNFGIVPVLGLGAVLTAYGVFFDKIKHRKILDVILGVGLTVLIVFGAFLGIYGNNDTADYTEQTVIVLGCAVRGEPMSIT